MDIYNQPSIYTSRENNNRDKASNWYLSSANFLRNGNDRIKRGDETCLGQRPRGHRLPFLGSGRPQLQCTERPLDQKGRGCQAMISLDNLSHNALLWISSWPEDMHAHLGGSWVWSGVRHKVIGQRKTKT